MKTIEKYLQEYEELKARRKKKRDAVIGYVEVASEKELDKFIEMIIEWNEQDTPKGDK